MSRLADLRDELLACRQNYPWQFFDPLPKQAAFQRYVGEQFQVVLFAGGNWTGKTHTGANTAVQLAFTGGVQIGHEFMKVCPVPNQGRIATEKELVEKDVVKHLKKQMGNDTYVAEKKGRPFYSQWQVETESTFDIMTYDQQPKQFEGVELNWAWLNEPSTEAQFHALLGRFKKGGVLFLTATTLGAGWILDVIIDADNPEYKYVYMDVDENRESLGGHLPDEAVDKMLASMDPEEREARKTGKALKLSGRVFKNFNESKFVQRLPVLTAEQREKLYVVHATDPHDRLPHYSAWGYLDEAGRVVIFWEHPEEDFWEYTDNPWGNPEKLAESFFEIERGYEVGVRLLDKKFGNTKKFGEELTVLEQFQQAGLYYQGWWGKDYKSVNIHIRKLIEEERLIVGERCRNMIRALKRHRFLDQTSSRAKDERGRREDVDAKYRHPIDALGAICEVLDGDAQYAELRSTSTLDIMDDNRMIEEEAARRSCGADTRFIPLREEEDWNDGYFVIG